jgi:hypothetical protein
MRVIQWHASRVFSRVCALLSVGTANDATTLQDCGNSGGAAENCELQDCQHDMRLSRKDVGAITSGWCNMMQRAQAKVLEKGGFDWRMSVQVQGMVLFSLYPPTPLSNQA